MEQHEQHQRIVGTLLGKSCMKQDVFHRTTDLFRELKEEMEQVVGRLAEATRGKDDRLALHYRDCGEFGCEARIAGDLVIFQMHTNVFLLDQGHSLWRSGYLEEDRTRGYFGVVNVFNFLNDSFKYNRERDLGYLVARIFINREGHFFVQGKKQLGFLYNDLVNATMDRAQLRAVLESVVLHVLEFDLLAPPYDQVDQVTVSEMNELKAAPVSTGKRLGFRFQADEDPQG
jgi:hypothetical protein